MLARPAGDSTGSDKPQRFLRREGRTYPLGTPEDFIGPSNAAHPHARFREKEGPAPQKGGTAPSWLSRRTRGMRGLALTVASVNYMDNSLGKVKKAHRTRAVIMHSNSQQLTVDRLFRELALRRAAHDCITADGSSGAALRLY